MALAVDGADGDRHVLDLELVDGLHAEVLEGHRAARTVIALDTR
jgi:hypothetical protein